MLFYGALRKGFQTTNTAELLLLPAGATWLSLPPSVGLCLSPAPPGGHTPAAASCCSPSALFGSGRVQLAAPSAASESE